MPSLDFPGLCRRLTARTVPAGVFRTQGRLRLRASSQRAPRIDGQAGAQRFTHIVVLNLHSHPKRQVLSLQNRKWRLRGSNMSKVGLGLQPRRA